MFSAKRKQTDDGEAMDDSKAVQDRRQVVQDRHQRFRPYGALAARSHALRELVDCYVSSKSFESFVKECRAHLEAMLPIARDSPLNEKSLAFHTLLHLLEFMDTISNDAYLVINDLLILLGEAIHVA